MQFRPIHGFLSNDRSLIESKKKAQWFSNILIVEIRNSEEDFLPVGFRVWVRVRVSFRVGGGQFSSAAIVLEPQNSLINIGENGLKIIIV